MENTPKFKGRIFISSNNLTWYPTLPSPIQTYEKGLVCSWLCECEDGTHWSIQFPWLLRQAYLSARCTGTVPELWLPLHWQDSEVVSTSAIVWVKGMRLQLEEQLLGMLSEFEVCGVTAETIIVGMDQIIGRGKSLWGWDVFGEEEVYKSVSL